MFKTHELFKFYNKNSEGSENLGIFKLPIKYLKWILDQKEKTVIVASPKQDIQGETNENVQVFNLESQDIQILKAYSYPYLEQPGVNQYKSSLN